MPTSVNLNAPFAQALIAEGQKRGYSPLAIAASIGNASQENGLRTNGAPGDKGTAYGGFQWRHDRYQNLRNTAGAMGKAWDDPSVQAAHWFNEMDGKYGGERRYGDLLKSATTPEAANDAVIRSLRPAGSQNGPRAAHNYAGRMGAVNEAFSLMGNQPSPQAPQGAPTGPDMADLPAEGAQNAQGVLPGAPAFGGSQAPAQKTGWDGFMEGGPGALFGAPQQGWNMGDALMGAGAALMSRDNPEGAKSLLAGIRAMQKVNETPGFTTQIDNKTGRAYIYDDKGNVQVKQVHEADKKPITEGAMKMLQGNFTKSDQAYDVLQKNQEFLELLKDGKVDMSAYSRLGSNFRNFMNDSDEGVRNAARMQAHLEDVRNARLLDAKGTQTEGDAQRALDAILPGLAKYDNKTVASLLRDANKGFESAWQRNYKFNEPILRRYQDYDPDGFYANQHNNRAKDYGARRDQFDKDFTSWTTPAPTQAAPGATQGPTGRDPVKFQAPKRSFLEHFDRKK